VVFALTHQEAGYVDSGSQILGQSVRASAAVKRPGRPEQPHRIGPLCRSFGEFIIL
jgi:hypothetical protein